MLPVRGAEAQSLVRVLDPIGRNEDVVQPNKYLKEKNLRGKKNTDIFKKVLYLRK